jgi:hypothetical protein
MHGFAYKKEDPHSMWSTSTIKSGIRESLPYMLETFQKKTIKDVFTNKIESPGRFYVSTIVKMTVIYLVTNFDLKLVDEGVDLSCCWRTKLVPSPWLKVHIWQRS